MTSDTLAGVHPVDRLAELADGELSGAEAQAVRAHLASCASCADLHARAGAGALAARSLGRTRAPLGFGARVLKRLRRDRHLGRRSGGLDQKVPYEGAIIVLLVAAAAAVLVGYEVHVHGGLFARNDAPAAHGRP